MKHFIDRKILISMLFLALFSLGIVSYRQLEVELLPNIELPMLFIVVNAPYESDPRYIEHTAVLPLEGAATTLENVEKIETRINSYGASIVIELTRKANATVSYLKLIEKIKTVSSSLPDGFVASVHKFDVGQMFDNSNRFMIIQATGEGSADRIRNIVESELQDRFMAIDGVATVSVYGGREFSVEIVVNENLSESYGITLGQISRSISGQQNEKMFVGKIIQNNKEMFVTVEADYNSITELENIVLKNDGTIRLKDVAEVNFGMKKEESFSRTNGMETVSITISRVSQVNLISLSEKVIDEIGKINDEYKAQNIELSVEYNGAETMKTNIDRVIWLAITGGLLAIFLLWFFLRNFYLVFVAMIAIPVSLFSAFNFFYGANITINILTLLGLTLAVGLLIDNNVVVMENVHRLSALKLKIRESVILGTKQVWRAVTAATLTTITVFLPFIFSNNMIFKLVAKHISISIITTLIISLVVALILVPVLINAFMQNKERIISSGFGYINLHNRLVQIYIQLLKVSLRHPVAIILGTIVLLFLSFFLSATVSLIGSKEVETPTFYVSVEMPSGATLESTDNIVRELETRFKDIAEKPNIISQVNREKASITIKLQDNYPQKGDRTIPQIRNDIKNRFSNLGNASITLSQNFETSGSQSEISSSAGSEAGIASLFGIGTQTEKVVIKGDDFDKMLLVGNDIKYYLEKNINDLTSVSISTTSPRPEIHLGLDPLIMSMSGITPFDIVQELSRFQAEISTQRRLKLYDKYYEINIKTTNDTITRKKNIDDLKSLQIRSSKGTIVSLQEISTIDYGRGRSEIRRVNQDKIIEVKYIFSEEVNNSNTLLEASREEVRQLINILPIPPEVSVTVVQEEDLFEEFKFLIIIAILLIYMILAAIFGSFSAPFVMMFTVPLAATGSLLALTFTGTSLLSLNTLIGFLILLGVVINNGIILMDYANHLQRGGTNQIRALMQAGIARIRPVIITAGTTIIAMLPLAMGRNEYAGSLGAPFAITVIGGLSVSTVLTLIFIPTFSYGLNNAIRWIRSRKPLLLISMFVSWAVGLWLIFGISDNGFVWKLVYLILLAVGVPAIVWFVTNSLRRAKESTIKETESIVIKIQNLVKIYDWQSRFMREWNSRRDLINRNSKEPTIKDGLSEMVWQLPLLGFSIYFVWFYITGNFMHFLFSIIFYITFPLFFTIGAGRPFIKILKNKYEKSHKSIFAYLFRKISNVYHYGFPLLAGIIFFFRWESKSGVVVVMLLLYAVLMIINSSRKLNENKIVIPTEKGIFKAIKRKYLTTIRQLPIIGAKKEPFKAVKSVSLEFETGMIGLLGPNGAGKSTLMRIICGILEQSYGKIFINGIDTTLKREELQGLIGYLPQEFGLYENMTAYSFLDYQALLKNINNTKEREDRIDYVLKSVRLWERRYEKIASYSGGMKQRIGIAMILLHLPRILIVDEPTAGLDPSERIRFRNLLVELSRERVVLFSTHIIEDISSSCNRVAVMHKGELKYWGTPVDMIRFAEGKVWQTSDNTNERVGNLRCISENRPCETAISVKPSLEDAYLLMIKDKENL